MTGLPICRANGLQQLSQLAWMFGPGHLAGFIEKMATAISFSLSHQLNAMSILWLWIGAANCSWAREMGCRAVSLRSNVVRDGAHAFYEKAGYRRIKTQHVFQKELKPAL